MSVRPRHRRKLAWSFEAYVRPDLPERDIHERLEELLPDELIRGFIKDFAKEDPRPASFVMGFSEANASTDTDPAYLVVSVRCQPGAMSREALEETCDRALQAIGLRFWFPAEVKAFPEPRSFRGKAANRQVTSWNWNKAFSDGPHHAAHYRRIGKQQDRRRVRHAIDQALRTGRYTAPVRYGPLPRQLLIPPRGLEDTAADGASPTAERSD